MPRNCIKVSSRCTMRRVYIPVVAVLEVVDIQLAAAGVEDRPQVVGSQGSGVVGTAGAVNNN